MSYQSAASDNIAAPVPNKSVSGTPFAFLDRHGLIESPISDSSPSVCSHTSGFMEEPAELGPAVNRRPVKLASSTSPAKIVRFDMKEIRLYTIESKENDSCQVDGDNEQGESQAGNGEEEDIFVSTAFQSVANKMSSPPPATSAAKALSASQQEMILHEMRAELLRKNRRLASLQNKLAQLEAKGQSPLGTSSCAAAKGGKTKPPRLPTLNLNLLLSSLLQTLTSESKLLSHTRLYVYLSALRESYDSWSASTNQLIEQRNALQRDQRETAELLALRTEENAALLSKLAEPASPSSPLLGSPRLDRHQAASRPEPEMEHQYQYRQLLSMFSTAQTNYEDQISELSFQLSHLSSYSSQLECQVAHLRDELERLKISYQELYAQNAETPPLDDIDMVPIAPLSDAEPIFSSAESQKLQSRLAHQASIL